MGENKLHEYEVLLKEVYQRFNDRDIEATLAAMHPEVEWPNAMEGKMEHGHEAIRNYWTKQWQTLDPYVEPIHISEEGDQRMNVTVHQKVYDKEGKLLVDHVIHHIYSIDGGLIRSMEIKKTD